MGKKSTMQTGNVKSTQAWASQMGDIRLAQAWVPDQPYERLFSVEEALEKGTIFPGLYQPYKSRK